MIDKEVSWRLTASHLFALTAVVTAVDHSVVHLFVQWLTTSHLIQRPAAFCAFTSFLEMKSPCQHKAADVCVVVVVVLSATGK